MNPARRWTSPLLAGLLTVGLVAVSAIPAHAHRDACVTLGVFETSVGLQYPLPGNSPRSGEFDFRPGTSQCASLPPFSAEGSVAGFCGVSSGSGSSNTGHSFSFLGVGDLLIFTGEVVGTIALTVDLFRGSCSSSVGAWAFNGVATVALVH